jgi:hypothetical protein
MKLIRENGWSNACGSITVFPYVEDYVQFNECLPHFKAIMAESDDLYGAQGTMVTPSKAGLVKCNALSIPFQMLNVLQLLFLRRLIAAKQAI